MACRNIVTVPVMSQTLLNVLFDSQLAAHEKLNEDAAVTAVLEGGNEDRVALIVGNDPRTAPYRNEAGEIYDLMIYTDSPETMCRIMKRIATWGGSYDVWLYEGLGHKVSLTDGEDYVYSDQCKMGGEEEVSAASLLHMLRHADVPREEFNVIFSGPGSKSFRASIMDASLGWG